MKIHEIRKDRISQFSFKDLLIALGNKRKFDFTAFGDCFIR
ncbi:MAG: hypothetical protein R6U11_09340 [Bacteroidales bacterium]